MTDDDDSHDPTSDPNPQPVPQLPVSTAPTTPAEYEIRGNSNEAPSGDTDTAKELAREFRWVEFAQLIVNGVLAIIGVIALCIYGGQLRQMIESNKINRDSLVAVQRAFIYFKEFQPKGVLTQDAQGPSGRKWNFIAATENSGNTPAIEAITAFGIVDHYLGDKEFIGVVKKADLRKTAVGPKAPLYLGPQQRSEDFLFGPNALKQRSKFRTFSIDKPVIFFGWIAYRDVFPNTKLHITEFCQQLIYAAISFNGKPPSVMPKYPQFDFGLTACPEHNCTDEYCSDYKELETFVNSPEPKTTDPFGVDKLPR